MDSQGQLLRARDIVRRLGISNATFCRWRRSAAVNFPQPRFKVGPRSYWSTQDVERWLAQRPLPPAA